MNKAFYITKIGDEPKIIHWHNGLICEYITNISEGINMKIEAVWQKSGLHFKCTSESQHTIDLDSGLFGETNGPTPMEIILEAVACCSGMDVVSILDKRRKASEAFSIIVDGERAETHPKKFQKIHIHYSITNKELTEEDARLIISLSIEKYCSALASLHPDIPVTWDCEVKS
jgi:putative redox protein